MSALLSRLKSATAATVKPEIAPKDAAAVGVAPFISHIAVLPAVSRQSRSPLPSPLKSPVPTIDQFEGTLPTDPDPTMVVPLMNQMTVLPDVSRQRRSALRSPSKSRVPTIDQDVATLPTEPPPITDPPCSIHAATSVPLRQTMSLFASPLRSCGTRRTQTQEAPLEPSPYPPTIAVLPSA